MSAQSQRTVTLPSPRAIGASRTTPEADRDTARIFTAIALSSIAAGAINLAAAATVGSTAVDTLAFFVAVAAAQIVWGTVALVRAPRWWLALGALAYTGLNSQAWVLADRSRAAYGIPVADGFVGAVVGFALILSGALPLPVP